MKFPPDKITISSHHVEICSRNNVVVMSQRALVSTGCCWLQRVAATCNSLCVSVRLAFDVAKVILSPLGLQSNGQLSAEGGAGTQVTADNNNNRNKAGDCLKDSHTDTFSIMFKLCFSQTIMSPFESDVCLRSHHATHQPPPCVCITSEAQLSSFELLLRSVCCSQPPASITKLHLINGHDNVRLCMTLQERKRF